MPPHCDSMDGPVKAATQVLNAGNVDLVLPYVPKEGEAEVRAAFAKATRARQHDPEACEVADLYFFENVVRVHRAGEGAPYTGLRPAGQDEGPVLPVAEHAIATGSPDEVRRLLAETVQRELTEKFDQLMALKRRAGGSVDDSREYVDAMLGFELYVHKIYTCAKAGLHESHRQPHDD